MNFVKNILKNTLLMAQISAAMLGFKTIDLFQDEVNAQLAPLKRALKFFYTKRKLNETLEIINLSPREIYIILNELNKEDINNLSPKQIYQILKKQTKDKILNVSEEWENINNIINNADYETIKKLHFIFVKYKLYNDEKILLNKILRIINLSPQQIYIAFNKNNIDNLSLQKKDEMLNLSTDYTMSENIDNINWETINDIINDADFETIKQWNLRFGRYYYNNLYQKNNIFNN
ncbi:MAG: hypothetical protein RCH30_3170 [Candidatus Phytoplasma australasiaticum]|uniref:Uncharacterized protein n=1 Tax=Candidatus Phytoplasma australasiaticum subsp. australasiaticum TaxID=2832407 RepID=A0AAP5CMB6_9MOLU|nr:hypothetical protein [Candidatus Phytoplasma australasiaticum]QLL36874.1 hypothetical protein EPWB_v2c2710 ['Echinacea purpurea' witches'-broom phytoplasma]WEX20470.1 MAG: hypothetical protein TB2022_3910 [Candidatus Phytoplasma aurantifolia]MDO8054673.1 hypothetical protein [Candidatus Phytoplasma australasiaticum]WKV64122.1 MAG: hypothetical protein NCHU2022_c2720 [Candidatus Phytoplasma australasiaticum]WMW50203.1 MAG: hypothetical protein RCH30_3170 [Candidatus Phytoplasma australasiati